MASGVNIEESPVGPVVRPPEDNDTVVLHLHGNQDGPEPALDFATRLALRTGATVVCPRYRATFPAAFVDVHSAYRYCQASGQVVVVGEELGAALAATLLVQLRDAEATPPRCAVLVSALLDLTLQTKSVLLNASAAAGFGLTELRRRVADYARSTPLTDPRVNPLYANLHGLPPIQLLVAGTNPLLDDSLGFATRAARSGVPVTLQVWPDAADFHTGALPAMAGFMTTGNPATQAATGPHKAGQPR